MTPDALGYVRCARCGVWRPVSETVETFEHLFTRKFREEVLLSRR